MKSAAASRFQPDIPSALAQAHDAQRGAITHLRMRAAAQDVLHQFTAGGTNLSSPGDQAAGRPFQVFLVRLGTVLFNGGELARGEAARMRGDAFAVVE